MTGKITKFDTFDALRFFAFFKVFLFHIPIQGFSVFNFIKSGGGVAVTFFFSLSGFLITYLILEEKKQSGNINLHYFFMRRALRIWPLYYAMLLFAFLTPAILSLLAINGSDVGYEPDWLMSVCFLENYKMILINDFPNVSPLAVMWSLCVEEHFYLIWGIALFFIPIKKTPALIVCAILLANVFRYIFYLNGWAFLDICTNLDYFAYGSIPAILFSLYNKTAAEYISAISRPIKISVFIIAVCIVFLFFNIQFQYKELIEPTILGLSFCCVLLLIVFEDRTFKIDQRNIFSRLGIYTYSLYVTHTIIINLFVKLFEKTGFSLTDPMIACIFMCLSFIGTVAVSMLTYYFIEKPFLQLKNRFRQQSEWR